MTKLTQLLITLGSKAYTYIKNDAGNQYGLRREAHITFEGTNVGNIPPCSVGGGVFAIIPEGKDKVTLKAQPFPAKAGYWNGPSVIPDDWNDGSMEASLWHDLIWHFLSEIAEQTGKSKKWILKWSNQMFEVMWKSYATLYPKAYGVKAKSRIALWLTNLGAIIKRLIVSAAIIIAIGYFCTGCEAAPPDWKIIDASPIEIDYGTESDNV